MLKKIVFMGTPDFSVTVLKSLYQNGYPITTVYTQTPKKSNRGQKITKSPVHKIAELLNIEVRTPLSLNNNDEEYQYLKKHEADLAIVVAYGKIIPKKLDLIYLDSYHEPNHVEKIFRYYYPKIKTGGFYIIDDICWLPYVKGNYRDNFGCEIANLETYKRLIEVYYKNTENFDLEFSFVGSGLAKIKKKTDNDLNASVKVPSRYYSLKNLIKKIIK